MKTGYCVDLFVECIVVGIITLIMGTLVGALVACTGLFTVEYPRGCESVRKNWNKYFAMEVALFFTGFFMHLFSEALGFNKYYVSNSAARKIIEKRY